MNPDEIVKPGTPETAWITPDGKYITTDPAEAKANGATNQVSAANVVFADGRRQWIVFTGADRSLSPGTYSPAGPQMGYDKDQQTRWTQQQATATRGDQEGDIRPSSGPTREVYRGGKWVVEPNPVYNPPAGATTAGQTVQIEGTPDPNAPGGFDNERPVKVTRDPSGKQVGLAVPLAGAELEAWRTDREKSRNPGNKSDAEIAADAEKERQRKRQEAADVQAAADRNKPGAPTLKPDGKGGTIAVQTMPDGSIKETPLPNVPSDVPTFEVGGVRYERKPDGTYAPVRGIPTGGEPAGAPPSDTTYGQTVRSLSAYRDFLNQQVTAGNLTPDQADKLMDTRLRLAEQAHNEQQGVISTQTSVYGQQVTQQGQQLRDAESRRNAAGSNYQGVLNNFIPILKYLPKGGGEAFGAALMGAIQYGQQQATAWGGMATPPVPVLGPAAAQANATGLTGGPMAAPVAPALPAPPPAPPVAGTFLAPNAAATEAARQPAAASGGATMPTPILAPPPPATAPAVMVTIRHKLSGQTQQVPLAQFNAMPDRDQYDVLDPNSGGSVSPSQAAPVGPVAPPTAVPDAGGAYAPQMGNPGVGATGDGSTISEPLLPHERVPVNPPAGAPGNNPNYPVGTMEPQSSGGLMMRASTMPEHAPGNPVADWAGEGVRPAEGNPRYPTATTNGVGTVFMPRGDGPMMPSRTTTTVEEPLYPSRTQGTGFDPYPQSFLSPYQQQPAAVMSQYDALIADPWISNDLVEEARRRVYGVPGVVAA